MNFETLLEALTQARIRFVIVGGVAMNLHGSAQNTNDLDIVYARDAQNVRKLVKALAPYFPQLRTTQGPISFRFDERTIKNGLNFTLETSIGYVDLLGEITGVGDYRAAEKGSIKMKLGGRSVRILDLPNLIRAKRATGRLKDKLALPELEALEELEKETKRD